MRWRDFSARTRLAPRASRLAFRSGPPCVRYLGFVAGTTRADMATKYFVPFGSPGEIARAEALVPRDARDRRRETLRCPTWPDGAAQVVELTLFVCREFE